MNHLRLLLLIHGVLSDARVAASTPLLTLAELLTAGATIRGWRLTIVAVVVVVVLATSLVVAVVHIDATVVVVTVVATVGMHGFAVFLAIIAGIVISTGVVTIDRHIVTLVAEEHAA